jgi:hypothetical protein
MLVRAKERFVISTWGGDSVWWRGEPSRRNQMGDPEAFVFTTFAFITSNTPNDGGK